MRDLDDQQTHDYFNQFTPQYDPERFEFAFDHLLRTAEPSQTLLDIGCGDGATLYAIKKRTPLTKITGLDISEGYLSRVGRLVGCDTIHGSILDKKIIDRYRGSFDFCTLGAVLHHLIADTRRESLLCAAQCLKNSIELLRHGGELIIFEPAHGPSWLMDMVFWLKKASGRVSNKRMELFASWLNFGAPVVSYYTPEQLSSMIRTLDDGAVILSKRLVERRLGGVIRRTDMAIIIKKAERSTP